MIDIGQDHQLMCNYYTLRQDGSRAYIRCWKFQGSLDGKTWTDLRVHENDPTMCKPGQFASWPVIYGDGTASSKDCFKMFNPVDHTTFNLVLNDWSAAFFSMFSMSTHQLDELLSKTSVSDKLVSMADYMNGYLMERTNRYGKEEVLELGMQEIRTYFSLCATTIP